MKLTKLISTLLVTPTIVSMLTTSAQSFTFDNPRNLVIFEQQVPRTPPDNGDPKTPHQPPTR